MPSCRNCSKTIPILPYIFGKRYCSDDCRREERKAARELAERIFLGPTYQCPECGRDLGRAENIRGTAVAGGISLQTTCPYCHKMIYLRR
jgi:hypothetical protein